MKHGPIDSMYPVGLEDVPPREMTVVGTDWIDRLTAQDSMGLCVTRSMRKGPER